jgi:LytS/YehU family sensor histidine kinase
MNTLNNIHALVDIDPERAKETIVELSKILRFVLYEGSKPTVPLGREMAFLEDYIRLMRMRYSEDKVKVTYNLEPTVTKSQSEVPPLMFITFVENAFKHGISYRQASFIDIDISTEGGKLVFICRNSKAPREEDKQGGVGLQNIKQRLELIYGKNYTLDIDEQSETYNIKLVLPLEK